MRGRSCVDSQLYYKEAIAPNAEEEAERLREAARERERRAQEAREERERAAEAARQAEEARHTLVVNVRSLDKYTVHINFHAQDRSWNGPGGDQIYVLRDSEFHTYRLTCRPGEKICYGAGRDGNYKTYWGVGISGRNGCTGCCMTCGYSYRYTLNGGSSSPSVSDDNTLNDAIDLATGLIGVAGALRNNSSPSVSGPAPVYRRPPSNNNSTITGSTRR